MKFEEEDTSLGGDRCFSCISPDSSEDRHHQSHVRAAARLSVVCFIKKSTDSSSRENILKY